MLLPHTVINVQRSRSRPIRVENPPRRKSVKHLSIAVLTAVSLLPFLLLSSTSAHAQVGSTNGYYPSFIESGAECWVDVNGGVRCLTPADECESVGEFYGSPYANVFQYALPHPDLIGDYDPGLACAYFYGGIDRSIAMYSFVPTGTSG